MDRLTHAPLQSVVPGPAKEQSVAHTPPIQTWLALHQLPQAPQSNGFVAVSTHTPLQLVIPTGHWHALAAHVMPPVHAFAQAPQLALSDVRSTQPPAQGLRPVEHPATHVPELHTKLAAQPFPQAPQLAALVFRLTQVPLQAVMPTGHRHAPPWQVCALVHTVPHAPQWFESELSDTQAP